MGMGVHGVVPAAPAVPAAPGPTPITDADLDDARREPSSKNPKTSATAADGRVGFVRGLLQKQSDGWPIPRRRFEFSVILVGEFGAILLIAPVYLIFGRLHGVKHTPEFQALCSLGAQMLQSTELALGLLTMLLIPILPKKYRGTFMLLVGLAIILNLLILLGHQQSILMLMVAYPTASLLALVLLDAVTGIRPAAPQSPRISAWQVICGSAVTAMWVIPLIVSVSCKVFPSLFSQTHLVLVRVMLMIATLAAVTSGVCALHGYFRSPERRVHLLGRLSGSLALAISMALGLWGSMVGTGLIRHQDKWLRLQMLWIFLLVSGALMLCWGGLTQRLINVAVNELEVSPTTSADGLDGAEQLQPQKNGSHGLQASSHA